MKFARLVHSLLRVSLWCPEDCWAMTDPVNVGPLLTDARVGVEGGVALYVSVLITELEGVPALPGDGGRAVQLPLYVGSLLHLPTGVVDGGVSLLISLNISSLLLVPVGVMVDGLPVPEPLVPHGDVVVATGELVFPLALLQVVLPAALVDLPRGPGHLARALPPPVHPVPIKHLPTSQVIRVELDTALAVWLVIHNISIVHS